MGDKKKAILEFNKMIQKDSGYTDAYVQLGKIYYESNNTARAKKYFQNAYERELLLSGYAPYNSDLHYYLGMIAVKEERKLDAILSYMDLKSTYDSTPDSNQKKLNLYKAIMAMEE